MGKVLILIMILIFFGALWSLPLYVCVNLVLWAFHLQFHITLWQSFTLCLLANIIHTLLFKDKEDK